MRTCHHLIVLTMAVLLMGCTGGTAPTADPPAVRLLPARPSASLLYLALGDSTVEGIGASSPDRNYVGRLYARLRAVYPSARVMNLGTGGATAADVRSRQLPRSLELQPDLVTLSIGPNDITEKRNPREYASDVEAILRALARRTTAVVVVNLIPDLTVTPRFKGKEIEPLIRQRVVVFNEILSRQALAWNAEVVDLYGPSQREVPQRAELIAADRYHPSDEGYARWAELMWTGIERRMQP
jgi:lysophospholipase L1-like esterase